MNTVNFSPIGIISSCFKEKFGIPRQPNLVTEATSSLIFNDHFTEECVRGLDGFSHIWISFVFHETLEKGWKPMVRPPRLGGNSKVGVFASRSPFRPNALGLSVVAIESIDLTTKPIKINLLGCDLLDGTPVLDIKPYLPYVDSIPDAKGGFAHNKPEIIYGVVFSSQATAQCMLANTRLKQDIRLLIEQILQLDPRPSYKQNEDNNKVYSMKLFDFDLKWQYCENEQIEVLSLN